MGESEHSAKAAGAGSNPKYFFLFLNFNVFFCLLMFLLLFFFSDVEHGAPIRIVYVPSHLYHMLFELFKNAMRAVMEHHGDAEDGVPPVEVVVCRGKEDICVKVTSKLFLNFIQN